MPWSPDFENAQPDARLDAYRNRAAELVLDGAVVGHVLVETDYSADQHGGRLWWRRWQAPAEFAKVFSRIGEDEQGAWISSADLDVFARWAADGFRDGGTTYAMTWLDEAGSRRVHDEVFDHHH